MNLRIFDIQFRSLKIFISFLKKFKLRSLLKKILSEQLVVVFTNWHVLPQFAHQLVQEEASVPLLQETKCTWRREGVQQIYYPLFSLLFSAPGYISLPLDQIIGDKDAGKFAPSQERQQCRGLKDMAFRERSVTIMQGNWFRYTGISLFLGVLNVFSQNTSPY